MVIVVYRRPVGPEKSGCGKSKHSEPRGLISNNCKAKQVRDDEAMTEHGEEAVIKVNYFRSRRESCS